MTSCFGQWTATRQLKSRCSDPTYLPVHLRVNMGEHLFARRPNTYIIYSTIYTHTHLISRLTSIVTLGFLRDWLFSLTHVSEKAVWAWVLAMSPCQIPNRRAASRIQQSKWKTSSSECLVPFWIVKPLVVGWDDYKHQNVLSHEWFIMMF